MIAKPAADSVAKRRNPDAIGGRLFSRNRGRIVVYKRTGENARIENQACEHGVSAAHPSEQNPT